MMRVLCRILSGSIRDGANRNSNRGYRHQRSQQNMRCGGQTKTGHRHPHAGAEQRAEAVKSMHHRQDGFIHFALDGGAFNVNRHLRRTEAGAENGQPDGKQDRRGEPQRHAEYHHADHGARHGGANHLAGAKTFDQPRRAENPAHRTNRQAK